MPELIEIQKVGPASIKFETTRFEIFMRADTPDERDELYDAIHRLLSNRPTACDEP